MREFFKGWRRKVGCGTLVLACVIAIVWMRSLFIAEGVMYRSDKSTVHNIRSTPGGLIWSGIHEEGSSFVARNEYYRLIEGNAFTNPLETNRQWSCNLVGIEFGATQTSPGISEQVWVIRYWTFAVPLTLLSAYLILWKPRKPAALMEAPIGSSDLR